jgi:hypothetical protein
MKGIEAKIKELIKLLETVEKLIIKLISLVGWIILLIKIL